MAYEKLQNLIDKVSDGAIYLDNNFPGWENKIQIQSLFLRYAEECILGQLGEYSKIIEEYSMSNLFLIGCGFLLPEEDCMYYPELTNIWKKEILKRRNNNEHDSTI